MVILTIPLQFISSRGLNRGDPVFSTIAATLRSI